MPISRRCPRARRVWPASDAHPPLSALAGRAGGSGEEESEAEVPVLVRALGPTQGAALRRGGRGLRPHPALRPGREREPGAEFSQQFRYFVQLPIFTQASLPPLNETPLLRDVQPLHLIKEIALQC